MQADTMVAGPIERKLQPQEREMGVRKSGLGLLQLVRRMRLGVGGGRIGWHQGPIGWRRRGASSFLIRFKPTTHPGCRSGGLGMGLSKPSLPTSQYVSSIPLPWKNTKKGRFRQTRVRDGEGLGPGETGRLYICIDSYKVAEYGPDSPSAPCGLDTPSGSPGPEREESEQCSC